MARREMVNATNLSELSSAMYRGEITHHRYGAIPHSFRYRVTMPLLYLDEIESICDEHHGWNASHRAPVEFRRRDFIACEPASPHAGNDSIATAVAQRVVSDGRSAPAGRIAMLANLRTLGWQFNPIALYFCFAPNNGSIESLVAEVTNTPWKQRHSYVIGAPGTHEFAKQLHVSPFMPMHHRYRFSYNEPAASLAVRMANYDNGNLVFAATMQLKRTSLDHRTARRYIAESMSARVSLGIYHQAAKLRRKGVAFVAHPDRTHRQEGSCRVAK